MASPPAIAVLIACHNRRDKTLACLAALRRQRCAAVLQLFIYDDGSSDGTSEAVCSFDPTAMVVRGDGTAFWAGAMRHLFDRALAQGFDHYLWLNDDVVLDDDAVERLLAAERSLAGRGPAIVGGAVRDPATGAFTYGGIDRRHGALGRLRFKAVPPSLHALRFCDTLHGNVVLVPAATARVVGSLGRAYVHTLGDLDYGLRVSRVGGAVALAPGFCGACAGNPRADRWFRRDTPLRERWRLLGDARGFPVRPWIAFARTHGGLLWPVLAALPFWRLMVPSAIWSKTLRPRRLHASRA